MLFNNILNTCLLIIVIIDIIYRYKELDKIKQDKFEQEQKELEEEIQNEINNH